MKPESIEQRLKTDARRIQVEAPVDFSQRVVDRLAIRPRSQKARPTGFRHPWVWAAVPAAAALLLTIQWSQPPSSPVADPRATSPVVSTLLAQVDLDQALALREQYLRQEASHLRADLRRLENLLPLALTDSVFTGDPLSGNPSAVSPES